MPVTSLDWIALIKYDFLAKSSEKCELLGLSAVWVSSLVGIVLLPVLLERGMFFEQFWCKT